MSGNGGPREPAAPMDFTDEEVRHMAGRRTKPVAAVARLKKLVPSGPIGKLVSERAAPPRVTRDELPSLRRAAKRQEKFLKRLTPSDLPAEQTSAPREERQDGPKKKPPSYG